MRQTTLIVLTTLCLLLLSAQLVRAEPPKEVAGEYSDSSAKPLGQHDEGALKLLNFRTIFDWAKGSAIGTSVADFSIRADAQGNGTFVGYETFTGTLDGRWGILSLYDAGVVQGQNYRGSAITVGGTDGLANAQLTIVYEGKIGVGGTYHGTIQFSEPR